MAFLFIQKMLGLNFGLKNNYTDVFRGFPRALQDITPWPLPSTAFQTHYSLIILPQSQTPTASLCTLQKIGEAFSIKKQKVLGRTNRILSFNTPRTA
jgi:hypothetical protein